MRVYVSVGSTSNQRQEEFVVELMALLKELDLDPQILGRTRWSADAPLEAIEKVMNDGCQGLLVVAFERWFLKDAIEKRGSPKQREVSGQYMPTPWNHIEAAMAYVKKMPVFVLAEEGFVHEGMLEENHDWYIQSLQLDPTELHSDRVIAQLKDWKASMAGTARTGLTPGDPARMSIRELVGSMRPGELYAAVAAFFAIVAAAFLLGQHLAR
ncbi:MAG: hypothetical protein ABSB75_03365 [Candidatus Limnocylindrales bacterium]